MHSSQTFDCHPIFIQSSIFNKKTGFFTDRVSVQTHVKNQGQARGYGRITHFLPLPLRGHHFQRATVTQWLDRFQIPGYQMKDMDIVFPLIPNGLL